MDVMFMEATSPFMVALFMLAGLVGIEIILLLLGAGLPEIDGDLDADGDFESGALSKALSFIGVGKVPILMVLMSFLAAFACSGLLLQYASINLFGFALPDGLAISFSVLVSVFSTGSITGVIARILPSEETSAVSETSLIGRVAEVLYGEASYALPADARVLDAHGKTHFIQLKSAAPDTVFISGQSALIVSFKDGFYFGADLPAEQP